MLITCATACLLLVANGAIVAVAQPWIKSTLDSFSSLFPSAFSGGKLTQIVMFGLPFFLLFVQWWTWDQVRDACVAWYRRRAEQRGVRNGDA